MTRFLLFLSSVLFVWFSGFSQDCQEISANSQVLRRFSFSIDTGKAVMSGLLLAKDDGEVIKGSMVNEFGVSAVDFSYTRKNDRLTLLNVVSFLDKWYIKRVLKKDIRLCIHILYDIPYADTDSHDILRNGTSVSLINRKRGMTYTFTPLNLPDTDDTEEQSL